MSLLKLHFDLLLLVRMYSPAFCETEQCTRPPIDYFSLHGLWPEWSNGSWPEFCGEDHKPFPDFSQNEQAKCEWPSFHGTDADFLHHEYHKHGSCMRAAGLLDGAEEYFNTTLYLHNKYDINTVLSGILPMQTTAATTIPTDDSIVGSDEIIDAIKAAYGAAPLLSCQKQGKVLSEIWMCLDSDNLNVTDCPERVKPESTCSTRVVLPASGSRVSPACQKFFPAPAPQQPENETYAMQIVLTLFLVLIVIGLIATIWMMVSDWHQRPLYQEYQELGPSEG